MSEQDTGEYNKDVVRRCLQDIWNAGNLDAVAALIHPNFLRHHERNPDEDVHGLEGFRKWVSQTRQALPDIKLTIEKILAENNQVMAHLHGRATHKGELKGVMATGNEIEWTVTTIIRLADGKIVECWAIADTLGILQRLGQIPPIG